MTDHTCKSDVFLFRGAFKKSLFSSQSAKNMGLGKLSKSTKMYLVRRWMRTFLEERLNTDFNRLHFLLSSYSIQYESSLQFWVDPFCYWVKGENSFYDWTLISRNEKLIWKGSKVPNNVTIQLGHYSSLISSFLFKFFFVIPFRK